MKNAKFSLKSRKEFTFLCARSRDVSNYICRFTFWFYNCEQYARPVDLAKSPASWIYVFQKSTITAYLQPRHSLSLLRHAHPESAGVAALQSAVNPASRTVTLGIVTGFVIFAVVNFAGLRFHRCSNHDQIASEIRYPQQLSTGGRKPTTTCSSPFLDISIKCDIFSLAITRE